MIEIAKRKEEMKRWRNKVLGEGKAAENLIRHRVKREASVILKRPTILTRSDLKRFKGGDQTLMSRGNKVNSKPA